MKKEKIVVKISKLANNNGQIEWLPKNPRQWTQSDIDRTKNSIEEDPDFLEDRPLLVTAEMIVFGGNLRLTAARSLKMKEVPAVVYTPENEEDKETIKRRAIKDNGSFGAWDYDALANEWDNGRLSDWGVPVWDAASATDADVDALFEESHNSKAPIQTIKIEMPLDYDVDFLKKLVQEALSEYPQCKII